METKQCTICKEEKPLTEFYTQKRRSAPKYKPSCKVCQSAAFKKRYYADPKKALEKNRNWRVNNLEKSLEIDRKCRWKNIEKTRERDRERYRKDKDKTRIRHREYQRKTAKDPGNRIIKNCRVRMRNALKGASASESKIKYLGCNKQEFKEHLEKMFRDGMSWDNYGAYWHIDHKIPVSWFNVTNENCLRAAFNYKNTHPLLKEENMAKGNRWYDV